MKKIVMTSDVTLGAEIDKLFDLNLKVESAAAKHAAAKSAYDDLEQKLIAHLESAKLEGAVGRRARVLLSLKDHPKIADMTAFWAYVKRHNAFELFQKRINVTAWNEQCTALGKGKRVPGTSVFTTKKLSFKRL